MPDGLSQKVEFQPREQLEKIQLGRLKEQLRYTKANSAFYSRNFGDAGVDAADLNSLEDMRHLPFITKEDLRTSQMSHPPFGDYLCVESTEIAWVPTTSGTTGSPTLLPRSSDDIALWTVLAARALSCVGLLPSDVYQNIAPYEHAFTGMILHAGAQRIGATVLNAGLGKTDRQLWLMQHLRTTVAHATPSYWLHLGQRAAELGVTEQLTLRVGFGGGEPGMKIESFQQRLRSLFPGVHFRDAYGVTDVGTPIFIECHEARGGHGLEDALILEVVSPDDGLPVPAGVPGELVITDLLSRTAPLLRFRTGDVTVYEDAACPCGRTTRRFPRGVIGRIDDMVTIKSVNVYPAAIDELLAGIPGLGAEWQLRLDRGPTGLDEPTLQVEVMTPDDAKLREKILDTFRARLRFSVAVSLVPLGGLPATDFKARRIIDCRNE